MRVLQTANGGNNPSTVYVWNGTAFSLTQSVPVTQVADVTSFAINGTTFIAFATLLEQTIVVSYNTSSQQFELFQVIGSNYQVYTVAAGIIDGVQFLSAGTIGTGLEFKVCRAVILLMVFSRVCAGYVRDPAVRLPGQPVHVVPEHLLLLHGESGLL